MTKQPSRTSNDNDADIDKEIVWYDSQEQKWYVKEVFKDGTIVTVSFNLSDIQDAIDDYNKTARPARDD